MTNLPYQGVKNNALTVPAKVAGETLRVDIDPSTPWTGVHRLVDSGGPLAKSDKRFKNFGPKGPRHPYRLGNEECRWTPDALSVPKAAHTSHTRARH